MYLRKSWSLVSMPVALRVVSSGFYGWSPCLSRCIPDCNAAWKPIDDHLKPLVDRAGWRGLQIWLSGETEKHVHSFERGSCVLGISPTGGPCCLGVNPLLGVGMVNRMAGRFMCSVAIKELESTGLHMLMLPVEEWNQRCREWKVQYQPNIYCSSPEEILETLKSSDGALAVPTLKEYFIGLGFKRHEFMSIINEAKSLLGKPMDLRITSSMKDLLMIGLTKQQLVKALRGAPILVETRSRKVMEGLNWFQSKMNMDYEEALNMLADAPQCFTVSVQTLNSNLSQFRSWGMSEEQLMEFVKKKPILLGRDPRDLGNKFKFAMKILGKTLDDVLEYPAYLAISERRITIRVGFYVYTEEDYMAPSLSELLEIRDKEFFAKHTKTVVNTFLRWWKWEKQHLKDAASTGNFLGKQF